jgi:hypothetical protein
MLVFDQGNFGGTYLGHELAASFLLFRLLHELVVGVLKLLEDLLLHFFDQLEEVTHFVLDVEGNLAGVPVKDVLVLLSACLPQLMLPNQLACVSSQVLKHQFDLRVGESEGLGLIDN